MTEPINLDQLLSMPASLTAGRSYRQVLVDAHQLLVDPNRWVQYSFAQDAAGMAVRPTEAGSCRWCLLGAVALYSNDLGIIPPQLLRFLDSMMTFVYGAQFESLGQMNDYLSHDRVLGFLQQCIDRFDA